MSETDIIHDSELLFARLQSLSLDERVETINAIRAILSDHSPFSREPVDCVMWVRQD